MFRNYIKLAVRNLMKHKVFSFINIFGLSMGLVCVIFIIAYVQSEVSYEKNFPKAERIFRVTAQTFDDKVLHWAATPPVLGDALAQEIPAIEKIGRLHFAPRILSVQWETGEARSYEEKEGYYADNSLKEIFDLNFLKGNPVTALTEVNSIVLTEETARRYFGEVDPIGLTVTDETSNQLLKVTGIIENLPSTTHLKFDYLISMSTLLATDSKILESKTWKGFYTYALLNSKNAGKEVEAMLPEFTAKFHARPDKSKEEILSSVNFELQPITDIHLHSRLEKEMTANGNIIYVYIFSTAAFLILLIACINFINISLVQVLKRTREVGVRKTLGAGRKQLVTQYLIEATVLVVLAAALVCFLIFLLLPYYNLLTGYSLTPKEIFSPLNIVGIIGIILTVGLLAALFPAFFLAGFNPVNALKGVQAPTFSVTSLRKALVVFQFTISVFMIISTLVIYKQMDLFQNKNLGFEEENIVSVKLSGELRQRISENKTSFKGKLEDNPAIKEVALASGLPGQRLGFYSFSSINQIQEADYNVRYIGADEDFIPAMEIELLAGENFRPGTSDSGTAFILNEAAVKFLGLKDPVGLSAISGFSGLPGPVVGITKDFNFASLHSKVEPLIIEYQPENAGYLLVKITGDEVKQTLAYLENEMNSYGGENLFSYSFLDENLQQLYDTEERISNIFQVFTGFTLLISCLGLFGLAAYSAERRTKEIGIRKLLGSSKRNLVLLLSKDFVKMVFLAFLIASPVAWYLMQKWLENFAYRINISWWIFVIAGLGAVAIAIITVSFHALKAAMNNPVKNLKIE